MPLIGTFKADKDGYAGTIRTLSINAKIRIVANDQKQVPSAPTSAEDLSSYPRVRLDDPAFREPIRAALMEKSDDGVLRVLWRREKNNDTPSSA